MPLYKIATKKLPRQAKTLLTIVF